MSEIDSTEKSSQKSPKLSPEDTREILEWYEKTYPQEVKKEDKPPTGGAKQAGTEK